MATTLSKDQLDRRAIMSAEAAFATTSMRKTKPEPISKESELCDVFIREFNNVEGWTCYPEAAGFDVLVVHDDGRQIGVEAKLTLNAKVADQILPNYGDDFYGRPGPDHRVVIVARITEASAGIAKMLHRLGVKVLTPWDAWESTGYVRRFNLEDSLLTLEDGSVFYGRELLYDWSPSNRCQVPAVVCDLPAGVPSPIRLTPWKEAAIKVVALMRSQGFITVKQIAEHGMGPSKWTQSADSKPAWLAKGLARGQWIETEHMPAFDKQHPHLYEIEVKGLASETQKAFVLT